MLEHPREGLQAEAVGQRQIQQHQIDATLAQLFEALRHGAGVLQLEGCARGIRQVFPHQTGVARIVLDEEDLELGVGRPGFHCGPSGV